jgi:hypothetical protein
MGCACKSNNGVRKTVTQITKRNTNTHIVQKSTINPERKQIIIKRPMR